MSVEQRQAFISGLVQFACNEETFATLKTNFLAGINNIPANLHSEALTNAQFKAQILRGLRDFVKDGVIDYIEHGRVMGGNFTEWLEELAAEVVPDHQANNAIRLWDTHFSPLVDIFESMMECMDNYYHTEWAPAHNNGNGNGNGNVNNEDPAGPADNALAPPAMPPAGNDPAAPVENPNEPASVVGGRRSRRKSRRNRLNRKSRRNNSRRNNSRRAKRSSRR